MPRKTSASSRRTKTEVDIDHKDNQPLPAAPQDPEVENRYKDLYQNLVPERDKLAEQLNVAHFVLGKVVRQLAENVTTIHVGTE